MKVDESLNLLTTEIQTKLNDAIASIINKDINFEIKEHGVLTISEVHSLVSSSTSHVTTVYIPLMGDVVGDIFLFLPDQSANYMADLMLGNDKGKTKVLSDFESSALKELGNITTGVIVTELANSLKLSMMLTTPNLATDMAGALVDQVLVQYGETSNDLLAIDFEFSVVSEEVEGSFLILFDNETSEEIRKKIKKLKK